MVKILIMSYSSPVFKSKQRHCRSFQTGAIVIPVRERSKDYEKRSLLINIIIRVHRYCYYLTKLDSNLTRALGG